MSIVQSIRSLTLLGKIASLKVSLCSLSPLSAIIVFVVTTFKLFTRFNETDSAKRNFLNFSYLAQWKSDKIQTDKPIILYIITQLSNTDSALINLKSFFPPISVAQVTTLAACTHYGSPNNSHRARWWLGMGCSRRRGGD